MKRTYPNYRETGLDEVLDTMTLREHEKLEEFLEYCRATAAEQKVKGRRRELLQARDIIEKEFSKWELADLRGFLAVLNYSDRKPWTRKGILMTLSLFIRWYFPDWSARFDSLNDLRKLARKCRPNNADRYNEKTLPTAEEVDRMIRVATNFRDKAYLSMAFEAGLPPKVQLGLRWSNLHFDSPREGFTTLEYVREKNGHDFVFPLGPTTTYYLKQWRHTYSFPGRTDEDLIFPCHRDREIRWNISTMRLMLRRLAKRAGVSKNVYPYALRHSALSERYEVLPEELHRKLFGHVPGSTQTKIYSHVSNKRRVLQLAIEKLHNVDPRGGPSPALELPPELTPTGNPLGESPRGAEPTAKIRLPEP